MDSMKSAWGMTMIADQIGDAMESMVDRASPWANASGTGLGGPEGPEPQASPRCRAPSLSQENNDER